MRRRAVEQGVATTAAAVIFSLTCATSVYVAKPLYGPLRQEFGWPAGSLWSGGALSLASTFALLPLSGRVIACCSPRACATAAALLTCVLLLLCTPTLTHLWQLEAVLLLIAPLRALLLATTALEVHHTAGWRIGGPILVAAALLGALLWGRWLADLIYRNSWREGAAAAGGGMLLLAAPLSYVLLPGRGAWSSDKAERAQDPMMQDREAPGRG